MALKRRKCLSIQKSRVTDEGEWDHNLWVTKGSICWEARRKCLHYNDPPCKVSVLTNSSSSWACHRTKETAINMDITIQAWGAVTLVIAVCLRKWMNEQTDLGTGMVDMREVSRDNSDWPQCSRDIKDRTHERYPFRQEQRPLTHSLLLFKCMYLLVRYDLAMTLEWPPIQNPPASASKVLEWLVHVITRISHLYSFCLLLVTSIAGATEPLSPLTGAETLISLYSEQHADRGLGLMLWRTKRWGSSLRTAFKGHVKDLCTLVNKY
jgi:hypothetical protein